MAVQRFHFHASDDSLADLRRRLSQVNWPGDFDNEDGRYGLPESWLRETIGYWQDSYDWRSVERDINALPNYFVEIDGVPVHFIHVKSERRDAIPIILTHGWPWSFWDWKDVIAALAGDDGVAFDIVVPSLPGFAFSSPLRTPGVGVRAVGRLWHRLMHDVLGYQRYAAAGGDFGSAVSAELGHAYPDEVIGVHLSLPLFPGVPLQEVYNMEFASDEQWMVDRNIAAGPSGSSHFSVHINVPQALAYGLADSPVGLAGWIWERRLAWSDENCDGPARNVDFLCTLASLYWLTNSAGTALRIYPETFRFNDWCSLTGKERPLEVPTGFAFGPKELLMFPRSAAERLTDLRRWTVLPRGGHFVAAEVPGLLAAEYKTFFSELR